MEYMKKISSVLIITMVLCGCAETPQNDSSDISEGSTSYETVEITNPFAEIDIEEDDNTEKKVISDYGWGINAADIEYLTYDENGLTVPIKVQNMGEEFNIGFLVYVDGIIQSYFSDIDGDTELMQSFDIPSGIENASEATFSLFLEEISLPSEIEGSELSIAAIVNPEYIPVAGEFLGGNHSGTGIFPIDLKVNSSVSVCECNILSEYDSHIITDKEKTRFKVNSDSEYSSLKIFLCPDSDEFPDWRYPVSEDGVQDMNLYVFAINSGITDYRLSLYKNNEHIKFNDGCDYIDITVKDNYMNIVPIELTDVRERDFVYCVAVPLNTDSSVQKNSDVVFFNEADIPQSSAGDWNFINIDPQEAQEPMYATEEIIETEITQSSIDPESLGDEWVKIE